MKQYSIKIELTIDQLQSLLVHTETEQYKLLETDSPEVKEWAKVRDQLAHHLVMLTEDPFSK